MGKNILIAGKDLPAGGDFADGMSLAGNNVVITGNPDSDRASLSSQAVVIAEWNRPSPVSARSLVLQAENAFGPLDTAVLYFDTQVYAQQFTSFSTEDFSRSLDEMTAGYELLTMEVLARYEQRKLVGHIVFVLKTPSVQRGAVLNPLVAASQAAFTEFAESVALYAGDRETTTVVLVTGDAQNETSAKDNTFASWLSGYIEAVDALKNKPGARQSAAWVKAGAKNPGGFSLFR